MAWGFQLMGFAVASKVALAGLVTLRKSARRKFVTYRVGIVQPGLSVVQLTPEQLAVLGSTNTFVQTVTDNPLSVVGSG